MLATLGTALAAIGFALGRSRRAAVPVAVIALALVASGGPARVSAQTATPIVETFTEEQLGTAPTSFSTPTGFWSIGTAGGADNKPVLFEDGTQWSGSQTANTLANQAKSLYGDRWAEFIDDLPGTAYFPIALFNQVPSFTGGTITARVAVVGGDVDQDAGVLFNYQPNGDMMALRIDTQENNMILTQWVQGQPSQLKLIENVRPRCPAGTMWSSPSRTAARTSPAAWTDSSSWRRTSTGPFPGRSAPGQKPTPSSSSTASASIRTRSSI